MLLFTHNLDVEPRPLWQSPYPRNSKPLINPQNSLYIMPVVVVSVADLVNLVLILVFPSLFQCVRQHSSSSDGDFHDDRLFKLLIIGLKQRSFVTTVFHSPAKLGALYDHRFRRSRLLTLRFPSLKWVSWDPLSCTSSCSCTRGYSGCRVKVGSSFGGLGSMGFWDA